ncbi:MAG TPA: YceD family protein [Steroidobacteraceae bacterium]|nr:YceD family protein [Steroidobacteraceae bacterium]HRX90778.1 YceD family protein [Steroidobacteraceae bacterium]
MPEDWSRRESVESLVAGERRFDFTMPLAGLPRLVGALAAPTGDVRGVVSFRRSLGTAIADIETAAAPVLTCQRCMQALEWPVSSHSQVALIADSAAADRVAEGLETFLVENDRVSVRDLVEEELLLALPLVPKCAVGSACGRLVAERVDVGLQHDDDTAPGNVQTPFAQLGELLKRDK